MELDIAQPAVVAARNLSGKRAFVTGATGMVGATVVRTLLAAGVEVHALVRANSSRWRIAGIDGRIETHVGDLTDSPSLDRAVRASKPEVVFHFATARTDPASAQSVNVNGLGNLLRATEAIDYDRLVVASSSLVCGKHEKPLDEDCEVNPTEFFGKSKAAAETLAREFSRTTRKPVVMLRLFSVYGDWEAPHRLIPTAILAALTGRPISLTVPGIRRDLIFVHDVAEALCIAAGPVAITPGEIINVGTGAQTANEETVRLIESEIGRTIEIADSEYPPRTTDTDHWVADTRKAKRILGWEARTTVGGGIRKTVDWMRENLAPYEAFAASEAHGRSAVFIAR
jgi:nucleoside-diphosphate-sugar epimerase